MPIAPSVGAGSPGPHCDAPMEPHPKYPNEWRHAYIERGRCPSSGVVIYLNDETLVAAWNRRHPDPDKDAAYEERNRLVALLASMFPSGIARTDIPNWLPEWHGCVYIDLPCGQCSWHYHDSHAHLFAHLPPYTKPWDGHTTDQKCTSALRKMADGGSARCSKGQGTQMTPAERAVVIARRRKRKAMPGMKLQRLYELKQAVTKALEAARK